MIDDIQLNVPLLRRRVPNLTAAARSVGLRPATVSNLCTGKIPVSRAEVKTLVALAALAGCTLDELIIYGNRAGMIETGIKVVDLFAPLVRGGTVGFVASQRVGQFVLLAELLHRLAHRGFGTVFWHPQEDGPGVEDVVTHSERTAQNLDEVTEVVESMRKDRDVVLAADRSAFLSGDILTLKERLKQTGARPVTFALVDLQSAAVDEQIPYGPLDALWQFDTDMAVRNIFPAIDPVISTSTLLEGANLNTVHFSIHQRCRKLLRRYRELRSVVRIHGLNRLPAADLDLYRRGERLESFLTQPFYVAEPFTKRSGEWFSLPDTLEEARKILEEHAPPVNGGENDEP